MGIFKFFIFLGIIIGTFFLLFKLSNKISLVNSTSSTLGVSSKPHTATSSANLKLNQPDNYLVTTVVILEVVDINTVKVLLADGMQLVDLIGIKIPTTSSQERYKKCFGYTIEESLQKIALGKKAFMIDDSNYASSRNSNKYIFLEDITFLNEELIKRGIVNINESESYIYKEEFARARLNAQNANLGVWDTECKPLPTPTVKLTTSVSKQKNSAAKLSPTPTDIPYLYAKLISSVTPTKEPSPTPKVTEKPQSIQSVSTSSKPNSLNPEIIFALINNHRQSIGKTAFEKDERLCSLARERGPELYDEIFVNYNVHSGLEKRNIPYWLTENMAHYDSEEKVFNWWMGSTIHKRAIESDNKYSCGECYGNSCAQLFTSWIQK